MLRCRTRPVPRGDNVFLWIIAPDSDVVRRRNVEDVAARIFLPVERFADGLERSCVRTTATSPSWRLSVMARLKPRSSKRSRVFHRAGVIVIAYADGVNSWPIDVRCRVLLAGGKHLLDAGAPVFEELLSEALDSETTALRQRRAETREM